jgi:hypothetical protein
MTTIDHVVPINVPDLVGTNELITLRSLAAGLFMLERHVAALEHRMNESDRAQNTRTRLWGFGGFPLADGSEVSEHDVQLLNCFFHWFGMSLCNYVRLVGYLGGLEAGVFAREALADPSKFELVKAHCDGYVDSIPELNAVALWRNKAYAHFAITAPRKDDTVALLDLTVMSPIGYSDGRFCVGMMGIGSGGSLASLPPWSVSAVFHALKSRYWPA